MLLGKLLYRVLFRDEKSARLWGFESADAAHDWAGRRHPGRDYVVRPELINTVVYRLMLRPTKDRLRRPPSLLAAVAVALVVMAGLAGAVSGRSDDLPWVSTDTPIPQNAFAQCRDGTFSEHTEFWNTCRGAHGVLRWLGPNVLCGDGRVLALNEKTSCGPAGVDQLLTEKGTPMPAASATVATSPSTSTSTTSTTTVRSTAAAAAAAPPTATPSCTATISNARPTRGATVTVSVKSNQPNAPVQLVINYRTTTMNQSATTDSTGSASVVVSIGAATVGYPVDVAIAIGAARCSTTFTPAA
jgi:hypothetical protein